MVLRLGVHVAWYDIKYFFGDISRHNLVPRITTSNIIILNFWNWSIYLMHLYWFHILWHLKQLNDMLCTVRFIIIHSVDIKWVQSPCVSSMKSCASPVEPGCRHCCSHQTKGWPLPTLPEPATTNSLQLSSRTGVWTQVLLSQWIQKSTAITIRPQGTLNC